MILNFIAPKLTCGHYSWIEIELYLLGLIYCNCYRNIFWICLCTLGGEKERFYFFLGFERVNTAWRPYRAVRPTGGPRKAAWQPRSRAAGQHRPIKGPFCIFFLFHHFPPTPHSLQKFLEFLELSESFLLASVH